MRILIINGTLIKKKVKRIFTGYNNGTSDNLSKYIKAKILQIIPANEKRIIEISASPRNAPMNKATIRDIIVKILKNKEKFCF